MNKPKLNPLTRYARHALLRKALADSGLKHMAVAREAGIATGTLCMLQTGRRPVTDFYQARIHRAIETLEREAI